MEKSAKIYIAGHHGLVGSAIWRNLQEKGYTNLTGRSHKELDLLDGVAVKDFFDQERPEYVILAAAHVGGIMANSTYRADFIYKNLQIQQNVIGESFRHGVKKLLFLGSTCIYPRDAQQPMKEDALLTSPLEYTNEPYGDWENIRYDLDMRPVEGINGESRTEEILAILKSYGISKDGVELWGTGTPLREFLWSEEMADASVFIMEHVDFKDTYRPGTKEIRNCHINIGTGKEISIADLAHLIVKETGYKGSITFNPEKPDGTMRKLTDVTKLHELGWHHKIDIEEGVHKMYQWYLEYKKK